MKHWPGQCLQHVAQVRKPHFFTKKAPKWGPETAPEKGAEKSEKGTFSGGRFRHRQGRGILPISPNGLPHGLPGLPQRLPFRCSLRKKVNLHQTPPGAARKRVALSQHPPRVLRNAARAITFSPSDGGPPCGHFGKRVLFQESGISSKKSETRKGAKPEEPSARIPPRNASCSALLSQMGTRSASHDLTAPTRQLE